MKLRGKHLLFFLTGILTILVIIIWALIYFHQQKSGLDVYCSTFLHFDNGEPAFIASADISFRLQPDHTGNVALYGHFHDEKGLYVIARTVSFNYRIINPGEIALSDMTYIKNPRDSTTDAIFKNYFFYVPEGTERIIRLRPSRNGYVVENEHSPVFMCLNKQG